MHTDIQTIVIDPSTLSREGLSGLLQAAGFPPSVRLDRLDRIDELGLPADLNAIFMVDFGSHPAVAADQVRSLRKRFPASRVVVLTEQYELRHLSSVLQAGASAYLVKTSSCDALVKSLSLVMLGEPVFPAAALSMIFGEQRDAPTQNADDSHMFRPLSDREDEILRRLVQGESNKVIARVLNITEATVKVHIKAILRKIRVKNRTQAAIWAIDHGLIPKDSLHAAAG